MGELTVWGFHMGVRHGADPIANGYITLGWPELGNLSKIGAKREAFKSAYGLAIPHAKQGTIPVSAGQMFRFLHEMKLGDIVVYPSKHDRMINIGTVDGDYQYAPEISTEYPNRRSVKWPSRSNATLSRRARYMKLGLP